MHWLAIVLGYDQGVLRHLQAQQQAMFRKLFLVDLIPPLLALPATLIFALLSGFGWLAGSLAALAAALFLVNVERFLHAGGGIPLHQFGAPTHRNWRPPLLPAAILFVLGMFAAQPLTLWLLSRRLDPVVANQRAQMLESHMASYRATALESLDVGRYKGLRRADRMRQGELEPLTRKLLEIEQAQARRGAAPNPAERDRLEAEFKELSRQRDMLVRDIEGLDQKARELFAMAEGMERAQAELLRGRLDETQFFSLRLQAAWKRPFVPFLCTLLCACLWALPFLVFPSARKAYERTRRAIQRPQAKAFLRALREMERRSLEGYPTFRTDRQPEYLDPPWNTVLKPSIYETATPKSPSELLGLLSAGGH